MGVTDRGAGYPDPGARRVDHELPAGIDQAALVRPAVWLSDVRQPGGRSPVVAALLSLVIPGAGHMYAGRVRAGACLLAVSALIVIGLILTAPLLIAPAWAVVAPVAAIRAHAAAPGWQPKRPGRPRKGPGPGA